MSNVLEYSDADLRWYLTECAKKGVVFNEDDEFRFLEAVARKTADGTDDDTARNEAFKGE